ncbi:MAG: hypothetical protein A6F71_08455 [Cycloclasticus sp. symbiont of Poecilosclerida sp. M]|nr:MAG: hypothetical protein A6F71_08455 [Cycloclasticus sp. symbiont of Poecilosclerida sp. M]
MSAIVDDNFELFTTLLTSRVNVNETDEIGCTALIYACSHNHPKMVTALLEKNANPHQRDNDGWTALPYSCCADISVLYRMLELGVDANSLNNRGGTTLMFACAAGNSEAVCVLLAHGVNVDNVNEKKKTALDIARHNTHRGIEHLLGVYKNDRDEFGRTAQDYVLHSFKRGHWTTRPIESSLFRTTKSCGHWSLIARTIETNSVAPSSCWQLSPIILNFFRLF